MESAHGAFANFPFACVVDDQNGFFLMRNDFFFFCVCVCPEVALMVECIACCGIK